MADGKGVVVTVIRAEDLEAKKHDKTSNPYFMIGISNTGAKHDSEPYTSPIIVHTLCPSWESKDNTYFLKGDNLHEKFILIQMKHHGKIKSGVLGDAKLQINDLTDESKSFVLNLSTPNGVKGRVYITAHLATENEALRSNEAGRVISSPSGSKLKDKVKRNLSKQKDVLSHHQSSFSSVLQGRVEKYKISRMSEEKLSEHFTTFTIDEIRPHLRTGDILLFSGTEGFSKLIKASTFSTWSHICMVVRDPSERVREVYGLEVFEDENVFVFESDTETWDGRLGGGVQMTGISRYLELLARDYNTEDKKYLFVVRHLYLPPEVDSLPDDQRFPGLDDWLISVYGRKYESVKASLAKSVLRRNANGEKALDEFFCSELVSQTLMEVGVLSTGRSSENYLPKDFSSVQSSQTLPLCRNARFSNEIRIISPEIDSVVASDKLNSISPSHYINVEKVAAFALKNNIIPANPSLSNSASSPSLLNNSNNNNNSNINVSGGGDDTKVYSTQ